MTVLPLEAPVMGYAWGSHRLLAELQSRPFPTVAPEAELWMGDHPRGPASSGGEPLGDVIARDPRAAFGDSGRDTRLPFLFKVLAVAKPLSIQAHPDADQAREGFARENASRIPLDAPNRNYRDGEAKPEILCALTPFRMLSGFRSAAAATALLAEAGIDDFVAEAASSDDAAVMRRLFGRLMALGSERRTRLLERLLASARIRRGERREWDWVLEAARHHPDDVGAVAPLLLEPVELEPGEAHAAPPGRPHSYLSGLGVELMGNSDNVLRCGLTTKHVDLPELMRVLDFAPADADVLRPRDGFYPSPSPDFRLGVADLRGGGDFRASPDHGFEILIVVEGEGRLTTAAGETHDLRRGRPVAILADTGGYALDGRLLAYRACLGKGVSS